MKKKIKLLKIRINNQEYLTKIINKYPKIKSGRKNYHDHYIRVLKNTLLTKFFTKNINHIDEMFIKKFEFRTNKKLIEINIDNKH